MFISILRDLYGERRPYRLISVIYGMVSLPVCKSKRPPHCIQDILILILLNFGFEIDILIY